MYSLILYIVRILPSKRRMMMHRHRCEIIACVLHVSHVEALLIVKDSSAIDDNLSSDELNDLLELALSAGDLESVKATTLYVYRRDTLRVDLASVCPYSRGVA